MSSFCGDLLVRRRSPTGPVRSVRTLTQSLSPCQHNVWQASALGAALVSPALTTLRIDKQELGELAMTMLLDRMAGRHTQHRVVIEPDLVVRASTFPGQRLLHVKDDAARQKKR